MALSMLLRIVKISVFFKFDVMRVPKLLIGLISRTRKVVRFINLTAGWNPGNDNLLK